MAAKMKLTYFDMRGLAENIRLIMAQAGVDYEDCRIEKGQWPGMKDSMPFGQVPALEYDGQVICQSIAIARFVAKENGLAGKDNWTQAQADMVVDCLMDLFYREMFPAFKAGSEEKKKEVLDKVAKEAAPKTLKYLARLLEQRGGDYFAGNELTWADIVVANMLATLANMLPLSLEEDFPTLENFKNKIFELPNIKKWIETRPVTEN